MKFKNTITILLASFLILLFMLPIFAASEYEKGLNYYKSNRYDKAREMFLIVIANQENGNAYYFLGEMEKIESRYREAAQYFEKAINTKSISGSNLRNAYWNIIFFQEQWGEYEKMALTCKEVWNRFHDQKARQKIDTTINRQQWSENAEAVAAHEKGLELKKIAKNDEAASSFKEAIKLDPNFLAPKFELGVIALHKNDMDSAANFLNAVTSKIPYYAEANLALADVYFSKRDFSRAANLYVKAEKFGFFDSAALYHINLKKAQCLYSKGELQEALDSALTANKLQPGRQEALTILSAIYIKQKNYEKAMEILRQANALNPNNTDVLYQMGSIYYSRKDLRYLQNFDRIFDLAKDRQEFPYPLIIPILINEHYNNKNYNRVNEIFASLEGRKGNKEMMLISAKSLYNTAQYSKAIEILQKLQLNDDEKVLLASAYVKNNQRGQAKTMISSLSNNKVFYDKAAENQLLGPIVRELDKEKAEQERIAKEKTELERQARERAEQEREARVRADQERRAKEKAELERTIKEKAEKERLQQSSRDREPVISQPSDSSNIQNQAEQP